MENKNFKKSILIFPIVLVIVLCIGIAVCFLSGLKEYVPYIASLALETVLVLALLVYFFLQLVKTSSRFESMKAEMASRDEEAKKIYSKISHDIRVPMNTVIKMTGESLENLDDRAAVEENLTKVQFSARLLLDILDDILDLSAIERMDMKIENEPIDFKALITELSSVCGKACADKGLDFSCELDGVTEESVIGDGKKLRQVLTNILTNAVKYTDEGFVRFSIMQLSKEEKTVKLRFVISDTGRGLDPVEFEKLQIPSFAAETGDSDELVYQKNGLGLSIAKSMTSLMNGTIKLKRNPVSGSEFIIDLPFECDTKKRLSVSKKLYDLKVLVIDDDRASAEVISTAVKRNGIHCDMAADAAEGLEKCKKASLLDRDYDIVFLGALVQDKDGRPLLELLKNAQFAPGKIIVMSYGVDVDGNSLTQHGADLVLSRPLFPSDIISAIESTTL